MIYKRCSRCGARIPSGSTCPCIAEMKRKRDQDYNRNRRDKRAQDFYNSEEWKRTRQRIMELDEGLDIYLYVMNSEVVPADTVHHIIPLLDDWSKRCDADNLISLSAGTHSEIERLYRKNKSGAISLLQTVLQSYRNR